MEVANQLDKVVINMQEKWAVVVDVAIPSDGNVRKKECHPKTERGASTNPRKNI